MLTVTSFSFPTFNCSRASLLMALCALLIVIAGLSFAAKADTIEKGEAVFSQCAGCHTIEEGGPHLTGPNLYAIFGRDVAAAKDYEYSEQLLAKPGIWDQDRLNRYIARPKLAIPGNKMAFTGITSSHRRADLIAWLKSNPKEYTSTRPEISAMRGSRLATACLACHSIGKGEANLIGPNLWGVVGRPVASVVTFDYSERLTRRSGKWTPASLDEFFSENKEFEQGSHMAFRRLTYAVDRRDIITWLSTLSD